MQIYLKGYYGYQNFWDEMLLFGVIEKIFSDYQVEQLVIEVGDLEWIKQRKERNLNFITEYYRFRGVEVNREKIQFFQPHQRSQTILPQRIKALLPAKWLTYLALILGKSPYRSFFKVFWGGEVIEETRPFPHNGRNIPFLYLRSVLQRRFELWGGFGPQTKWTTKLLSSFLFHYAKRILARDDHSYHLAKKANPNSHKRADFSKGILDYFLEHAPAYPESAPAYPESAPAYPESAPAYPESAPYGLLNYSPLTSTAPDRLKNQLASTLKRRYFASDAKFDAPFFHSLSKMFPLTAYDWTTKSLPEVLSFIKKSKVWIWSRLHFLYCFKVFELPFHTLHQSQKLQHNL